ncbi:hypothetical protein Hypma_000006 [Hypsizygus marmoreus]|uniref:DUF6532 domain-containing protein n=1 Tax=Hypsizygus marmoreus TaxID=39966 RepID=A0A369KEI5_HYPMA|nr:hypothetical protein Hypma_000006 [Hypsizygus marmoreus]
MSKKRKGHNEDLENIPGLEKTAKLSGHGDATAKRNAHFHICPCQGKKTAAQTQETKPQGSGQSAGSYPIPRPVRQNRGQGGVIAQLRAVSDQIRPDLQTPASKPTTRNIPNNSRRNEMAPPPKASRSKQTTANNAPVARKPDPPLATGPPKPVYQASAHDSVFGFRGLPKSDEAPAPFQRQVSNGGHARDSDQAKSMASPPPSFRGPKRTYGSSHSAARKPSQPTPSTQRRVDRSYQSEKSSRNSREFEVIPASDGEGDMEVKAKGERAKDSDEETSDEESDHLLSPEEQAEIDADPYADFGFDDDMGISQAPEPMAMDIDEQSPDKDERQASAALLALQGGNNDDPAGEMGNGHRSSSAAPFSVVDDHHARNRKVHAPNPKALQSANSRAKKTTPKEAAPAVDPGSDNDSNDEDVKTRAHRNSKPTLRKPTQIGFYEGAWVDVLMQAKYEFRKHIHLYEPFPEKTTKIMRIAAECVTEAIASYELVPGNPMLDESIYNSKDMATLVFEDASSHRGCMKKKACDLLNAHFHDTLHPIIEGGHNQMELEERISALVKDKLAKAKCFLGGLDEQGHTRNFGHSMIAALCQEFYYSGKEALGVLFPEEFEDALPRGCLAMACTCIYHALREHRTGRRIKFGLEGKRYLRVYQAILELIRCVDDHEYHHQSLEDTLRGIAYEGRVQYGPESLTGAELDFDVVLD